MLLEIFLIAPKVAFLEFHIFVVGLLENLFFVRELQQMICLVVLVVTGVTEVFLSLWFAVITVRHHKVPVHILHDSILGRIESILALAYILDDLGLHACLFLDLAQRRLIKFFAFLYRSFRKYPSLLLILVILIQQ